VYVRRPSGAADLETDSVGHAPHDLDRPFAEFGKPIQQLVARIGTVGEEMAQPRKEVVNSDDDEQSTVAVLHVGGMHLGCEQ